MIKIPKRISYDLPEGRCRAFLRDVFAVKKPGSVEADTIRFVWEITSLIHPRITYVAGKNYRLADSKLAHDLESWLGSELDPLLNQEGGLEIETLKGFVGKEADIDVVHITNDRDTAFRYIQKIAPPGELVENRKAAA
jgi:hypothetical protein